MINHKTPSLRQRLLLLLLGSVATLWLFIGWNIWSEIQHETEEVFDANLVQTSKLLFTLVQGELMESKEHRWHFLGTYQLDEIVQQFHHYEHKVAFQISDQEGNFLLKSPQAPEQPLSTEVGTFETRTLNGEEWRTFSLPHPQAVIHVGEQMSVRNSVVDEVTENLYYFAALSLPLLALLIWWSVQWGLRPISTITKNLAKREHYFLDEINLEHSPTELQPLIQALNQLFIQLQHFIDKERRFSADAAHELRTPLAAIKIQAEVAQNERDENRRTHALQQIISGVNRTTHLAEQLLALAKVDGIQRFDTTPIDLSQLIRENLEILSHQAEHGDIQLAFLPTEISTPTLSGNRELLSTLLRNLMDNAIRYTPAGGEVKVTLTQQEQQLHLTVRDSGPGIPEALQKRIFERFYRNSNTSSGSGLGLSICQRITEIHGAEIVLRNCSDPEGLEVTVSFPIHAESHPNR